MTGLKEIWKQPPSIYHTVYRVMSAWFEWHANMNNTALSWQAVELENRRGVEEGN